MGNHRYHGTLNVPPETFHRTAGSCLRTSKSTSPFTPASANSARLDVVAEDVGRTRIGWDQRRFGRHK